MIIVALIEHLDDSIGKVLQALKANGQRVNTLVIFASDNGGDLGCGANNGSLHGGFVGGSLIGRSLPLTGSYRVPMVSGLVLSLVINDLAPSFGAQKSSSLALKVAEYSYTPVWVSGALQILPALGLLGVLAGCYGLYLLYLGLPRLMKCPQEKAVGYTVVVVVCAIILSMVIGAVGGGKKIGPRGIDHLKPFIPDTFAGLADEE